MNEVKKETARRYRRLKNDPSYWANLKGEASATGKLMVGLITLYGSQEKIPNAAIKVVQSLNKKTDTKRSTRNDESS